MPMVCILIELLMALGQLLPTGIEMNYGLGLDIPNARASFGVVLQDSSGIVLATAIWIFGGVLTPEMVETIAILHGIGLCVRLGYAHVMVESDCVSLLSMSQKSFVGSFLFRLLAYYNHSNDFFFV
uniref:RNase H type-1 domain-containing protein n=1 Tax=Cannabis sativa TaxID=3483 RepID=A0A803NN79_CANSA